MLKIHYVWFQAHRIVFILQEKHNKAFAYAKKPTEKTQVPDITTGGTSLAEQNEEKLKAFFHETMKNRIKEIDKKRKIIADKYQNVTKPEQAIKRGTDLLNMCFEGMQSNEVAVEDLLDGGLQMENSGFTRMDLANVLSDFEDLSVNLPTLLANEEAGAQQTRIESLETALNREKGEPDDDYALKIMTNMKDLVLTLFSLEITQLQKREEDKNEDCIEDFFSIGDVLTHCPSMLDLFEAACGETSDDDIRVDGEESGDKEQILYER